MNFARFMADVAQDHELTYRFQEMDNIVIFGNEDRALEIMCNGAHINLYSFSSWTNDAIFYCTELNLSDPDSIDCVMGWLEKTVNGFKDSNHRSS